MAARRLDVLTDPARLVLVIPDAGDDHALAIRVIGEKGLAKAALIVRDEA